MVSPIKKIRLALFLTQLEFAQMLEVSRATFNGYERGRFHPPHKMLQKIIAVAEKNKIKINVADFFIEKK
ncbi:MAG TPA: helix-turn-helix transcriptional regulator [Rummeliibacillus sp.]|nr:helix-turn-helix transcriptional regulator [Rummeliibacillus sp.]